MSTRASIGIENADGTIEHIYSHSDGYPEYLGKMLLTHYSNESKVRELIALGDVSMLREEIGTQHVFHCGPDNQCDFYHRDRGESFEHVKALKSMNRFEAAIQSKQDWKYLFADGHWLFAPSEKDFQPLTAEQFKE